MKNGKEIPIDKEQLSKNNIKTGDVVSGYYITEEVQDQYTDGSYARSFTTVETFKITNKS